ncbi:adenylate kinase [Streptomyces malaysiensis]|uniref:adenylate kinase n=1 Tax=Streptomyces malaysiensis TaxID=92644 RepID=UPI0034017B3F
MRIVLIGPPGAGKGTQAAILSRRLVVPHISTGDLFRTHASRGTPLGREARRYLDSGELVPDHITGGMVRQRLTEKDTERGFILDGFPRTVPQAMYLSAMLTGRELDLVVELRVSEGLVVQRLLGRGRPDDTEEIIRHRQRVYHRETAPLLNHYKNLLLAVTAVGPVEEITDRVLEGLARRTARPLSAPQDHADRGMSP